MTAVNEPPTRLVLRRAHLARASTVHRCFNCPVELDGEVNAVVFNANVLNREVAQATRVFRPRFDRMQTMFSGAWPRILRWGRRFASG